MKKFISYTKGSNRFETYYFIWIGKLSIDIHFKKRKPLAMKVREYFQRNRTLTINF